MLTRRNVLSLAGVPAAASAAAPAAPSSGGAAQTVSLNGPWRFRLDPSAPWRAVAAPHTWQVAADSWSHYGTAWYEKEFDVPADWRDLFVRAEFEAVFHSAVVTVNGRKAGEHLRKGYTAFTVDLSPHLVAGRPNLLAVEVNNAFDDRMLPRGKSSDWAHDGGIYRPVRLIATPRVFLERLEIDASPGEPVRARAIVRNAGTAAASGAIDAAIFEEETGREAARRAAAASYRIAGGQTATVAIDGLAIGKPRLWHFDAPHLYRFEATLSSGHSLADTFGIRKIETRDGAFYLNGTRVRLMGVERMAGSNPEFGMAEPPAWLDHDHADMLNLNCIYTRVHWPQDRRTLDYCDRHGILIQTEVPTWGGKTFEGMKDQPDADIMENGLEQLREMIARDRNHPSIFSWGVCNEIGGQRPADTYFANRMYAEAKKLDPARLVTYASNSLTRGTPAKDVAGAMDYVMWNEYYESWYPGTIEDLARKLDDIHAAFPDKAIVISEYGFCACTPERLEGDARRMQVLLTHNEVFRARPWVAGLIFFCYNDYRTHVGDKGTGVMQQRVHGVVDLYGARKPSYEALRNESSPVEEIRFSGAPAKLKVRVTARDSVPSFPLEGYELRAVAYGFGDVPVERLSAAIPTLQPGGVFEHVFSFTEKVILRVQADVLRPRGVSTRTAVWRY